MYGLEFGWLNGALGVILRGAAMTLFHIAVTTVADTLISIVLASARSASPGLRLDPIQAAINSAG